MERKEENFWECKRCERNSNSGEMIPCPRGSCDATIVGKKITFSVIIPIEISEEEPYDVIEPTYIVKYELDEIREYNPAYGNNRICKCGHTYYRHFDSYEQMDAIGCKYCGCYDFVEAEIIGSFTGEYRWLSNFKPVKIVYDGIEYPSVEHAYQSAKSDDMIWKSKCASLGYTPGKIKRESYGVTLVENWDKLKVSVMIDCVTQKFNQEPYKTRLLATGDKFLKEGNNHNDTFWGVCNETGQGDNRLGEIIMNVRRKLIRENE